ncbi:tryptophan-rich sensory protein [Metabacillus sp. KIGAM252]|uniref:Tryptophan-rich sensory protein n=1 Tax=Metabacillus flavus TaxID=2823519 RepID=A0ABS5LAM7_9BACI|nr:tryptophan-rich sensory protein [Metabacillus flavus]MBS2967770.1 tryptophan-rich sensory protein [Metabacillus flavus]
MLKTLTKREKWMGILFSIGTLIVVMTAALIGFAYAPPNENLHTAPGDSFFWIAWLIVIPTWGIATWLVWLQRGKEDIRGAMVVFAFFLLSIISFFPNTAAANQSVLAIFIGDVIGIIESLFILWLYSRYSRAAILWLLPLVIWFPITTVIKFINL